ncbi:hypothetical protein VTN96DRAFT_8363 [Rasamsonia emersonii]
MVLEYIPTYRLTPETLQKYLEQLFPNHEINIKTNTADQYVVNLPQSLTEEQLRYIQEYLLTPRRRT